MIKIHGITLVLWNLKYFSTELLGISWPQKDTGVSSSACAGESASAGPLFQICSSLRDLVPGH